MTNKLIPQLIKELQESEQIKEKYLKACVKLSMFQAGGKFAWLMTLGESIFDGPEKLIEYYEQKLKNQERMDLDFPRD